MANVAAYIDGFNFYYGMKSRYGKKHLWVDPVALVQRLRPDDQITIVRYFTAIVRGDVAAANNQLDYIEAMKIRNGNKLEVRLGRFKDRTIRPCRRCGLAYVCGCGREYRGHEEKETDVALGSMMVADAALGVADTTLLISADTDLAPALEAIRLVVPDQRIYLALPPGNTKPSPRLLSAGDLGHFFIREAVLRNAQLPGVVHDPATGHTLVRPIKWR